MVPKRQYRNVMQWPFLSALPLNTVSSIALRKFFTAVAACVPVSDLGSQCRTAGFFYRIVEMPYPKNSSSHDMGKGLDEHAQSVCGVCGKEVDASDEFVLGKPSNLGFVALEAWTGCVLP